MPKNLKTTKNHSKHYVNHDLFFNTDNVDRQLITAVIEHCEKCF